MKFFVYFKLVQKDLLFLVKKLLIIGLEKFSFMDLLVLSLLNYE